MKQNYTLNLSAWIGVVFLFSLYFTNTNYVPFSALPFAMAPLIVVLVFGVTSSNFSIEKLQLWGGAYYLYSVIGTIVYDYKSLFDYDFYRYDGNFLISFLLLICIPSLAIRINDFEASYGKFIKFSLLIALPKVGYDFLREGVSTGYFVATNAFGGFVMLLVAQCYSTLLEKSQRNLLNWGSLLLALIYLAASTSRGSILGVVLGIITLKLIESGRSRLVALTLVAILIAQAVILFYTYPVYLDYGDLAIEYAASLSDGTKESNVMIRTYENWPRGLFAFLHSPIFGIGVGALNDFPLVLKEDSLLQLNAGGNIIYDSSHAHHTYLHILGEQGIVGLFLFLMMWVHFYRFIKELEISDPIKRTLLITFWALTFASFTEHRIPSPSNCFAFFTLVALAHGARSKARES